jgi:(p)ppGpp synthase/HD superfamily hydrolase
MSAPFSRDLYMRAWHFAAARHHGQKVPGSELPYITHVGAVAMEVLATLALDDVADPDLAIACALLHDTVEDTPTTAEELATAFGAAVAAGVVALSKDKHLPKAEQMADSLRRIQAQPREIWLVKLADRAVNMEPAPATWSMEKRRAYQQQANTILDQLGGASATLAARLREKIARYGDCITSA